MTNSVALNANARTLPFLRDTELWRHAGAARIANLVTPFLELYAPTAFASRVATGSVHLVRILSDARTAWHDEGIRALPKQAAKLALLTAMTAGSKLYPTATLAFTHGSTMCFQLIRAIHCEARGEHMRALHELLPILHSAIYLGSVTLATPELIALSLLAQACVELYHAYAEYCKENAHEQKFGPYPEIVANLLLATLRLSQALPQARDAYLDRFGKELSQQELESLMQHVEEQPAELTQAQLEELMQKVRRKQGLRIDALMTPAVARQAQAIRTTVHQLAIRIARKAFVQRLPRFEARLGNFKLSFTLSSKFKKQIAHISDLRPFKRKFKADFEKQFDIFSIFRQFLEVPALNRAERQVDFAKLLHARGFSAQLNGLNFSTKNLDSVVFKNMRFDNCNFTGANCNHAHFKHTDFTQCTLDRLKAISSVWEGVMITDSSMRESILVRSVVDAGFYKVDLSGTYFSQSTLSTVIQYCKLHETVFLGAKPVFEGLLVADVLRSDLTDALLCDAKEHMDLHECTPHRITRPVVAQGWSFEEPLAYGRRVNNYLKSQNVIRLLYECRDYFDDPDQLQFAVEDGLQRIRETGLGAHGSIPRALLETAPAGSPIHRVRGVAQTILQHANGIILPGGSDVEPEFYGEKPHEDSEPEPHYARSLLEFSLLAGSETFNVPLIGICRGFQMGAVFYGSKLQQDLDGHCGLIMPLERTLAAREEGARVMNLLFPNNAPIHGLSMHAQGVLAKDLGPGLISLLETDGVVKYAMTPDHRAYFAQFHPEAFAKDPKLQNNKQILDLFLINARANLIDKLRMELARLTERLRALALHL